MEGDAGKPGAIEPSLEDRRHPVPPGRKAQHERFSRAQALHISLDSHEIRACLIVCLALRERQSGLEVLGVKIEIVTW